jgi:uncharacterized protein (TIGR02611 family)
MAAVRSVLRFIGRNAKRVAVTIAGSLIVLVGVAGLALPVVPGWALIFVGLAVLATEYVWARNALEAAKAKAKAAGQKVRRRRPVNPGDPPPHPPARPLTEDPSA